MNLYKFGKELLPKSMKKQLSKVYFPINSLVHYGTTDMFRAIEIELNTNCNRKCSYCPNAKFDRGTHFMSESLYKKIIDELSLIKYNGRISPHFYGEPLLSPEIVKFIEYTRKKLPKSYLVIYTNGDFLTVGKFNELIKAGVDYFLVTQHIGSINPVLRKTLDSLPIKSKDKIVLQKFNEETLLSNRAGLVEVNNTIKFTTCEFPSTTIVIDYKGNVVLCCNDYFSSIKLGDLKLEKLMGVWHKKSFTRLRKNIKKGIFNLEICKKCSTGL